MPNPPKVSTLPPPPNPTVFANWGGGAGSTAGLRSPGRNGVGSTIMTGGQGLTTQANTAGKSLLGQ